MVFGGSRQAHRSGVWWRRIWRDMQFSKQVGSTCSSFEFALSTSAGSDCVGHAVRASTHASPTATVLSIDGIWGVPPQCHAFETT